MILSVSRRTDIPAFYTEWFFNRLKEGYALVRNPMSYHQVSRINLSPDVIDCIVFWTKNPAKMLDKLNLLKDYNYYFQITVNPYDRQIERNVPDKEQVVESFVKLSQLIGKKRTVWRYDPIFFTNRFDLEYHSKSFNKLASKLKGHTERCIISFIDVYKKSERNIKQLNLAAVSERQMIETGKVFSEIAARYGMKVATCSEYIDLSPFGIEHAKCIDDRLISEITGESIIVKKDKNQRNVCGCVQSIDIGAYNTCHHGCIYCYANFSGNSVDNNVLKHDPKSPMLIGSVEPDDIIRERKTESYRDMDCIRKKGQRRKKPPVVE